MMDPGSSPHIKTGQTTQKGLPLNTPNREKAKARTTFMRQSFIKM